MAGWKKARSTVGTVERIDGNGRTWSQLGLFQDSFFFGREREGEGKGRGMGIDGMLIYIFI